MKVHATGMLANVADPAVIELRYDASLFTGPGALPADPAVLEVGHAEGPNDPYFVIPTCLGRGAMPLGRPPPGPEREPHRGRRGRHGRPHHHHQQVDHPLSQAIPPPADFADGALG